MRLAIAESYGQQAGQSVPPVVTRFAPSPNGQLHLGHAYAAIAAHDFARAANGNFLLRIEDIDGSRSRPEHIDAIIADLTWLGLEWDGEIIFQSDRIGEYTRALDALKSDSLIYPCICTRSQIAAAIKDRPVYHGPDGPLYPGTCKGQDVDLSRPHCWRLDMAQAMEHCGSLVWRDMALGEQHADPAIFGDIILWRKDAPASYHLAATLDDAHDGVTHIVRGQDLFAYSALHRLLQKLFALSEPVYWHHQLILDEAGDKLAKSRNSPSLAQLRADGTSGHAIANAIRKSELPLGMTLSEA